MGTFGNIHADTDAQPLRRLDPVVREMLVQDLPVALREARAALERQDLDQARQYVHSVRGSAAFCRLQAFAEQAAQLEDALQYKKEIATQFEQFEQQLQSILRELERIETDG